MMVVTAAGSAAQDTDSVIRLSDLSGKAVAARLEQCRNRNEIVTGLTMKVVSQSIRFNLVIAPKPRSVNWVARLNLQKAAFRRISRQYESTGFKLTTSDSVLVGRRRYYSGVWARQPGPPQPLQLPDVPVPVSGELVEELTSVDDLMTGFLQKHNVAGATVAVARGGHLVYSRGFGWLDVERRTPMPPDAVMRIASISKPMTAVAVMTLVQDGKLNPDDPVMPILKKAGFRRPTDDRWDQITVRHLLQHAGGWDRAAHPDPMFRTTQAQETLKLRRPARPRDMVTWQMQQSLDFDPGSRDSYSNLGYCVLGRVIEAVSEQTYKEYVTEYLLKPLSMSSTRPGRTRLKHRHPDEVRYYMQRQTQSSEVWMAGSRRPGTVPSDLVDRQYGAWDLEVMDAHGGWLSSAPDLVTFASAVLNADSDLLSSDTVATMLQRPQHTRDSTGFWYGCGWNVRPVNDAGLNVWHNGALDGTASLLVRRWNGDTWAVLFNTDKSVAGERLALLIDREMHGAVQ